MKTIPEIEAKRDSITTEINNLELMKNAAIETKCYQVANDCKKHLAVRKRDRFILEWVLEPSKEIANDDSKFPG